MRKVLVLFGAVVLVVALASPSMAQFKSWGHMEIQTIYISKPDHNTGAPWDQDKGNFSVDGRTYLISNNTVPPPALQSASRDETWKQIAERFRFYLQYGDPKTVRAVIGFEADSSDWGQPSKSGGTFTGGSMGVYRTDQVQLEIKWAYLDFVIPNTPLTVTAGLQNFAYGGRLWMNNDSPGVKLTADFAPHQFQAFWWRENDQSLSTYGVNDTYGLNWSMTKQTYNVGAFGAYKNDLFSGASATIPYSDHPWWIGVNGGFRPGNFNLTGQFIYNAGKREFSQGFPDVDYEAWIAEARAVYQIGPGLFAGLEGFYSTGNDADRSDKIKIFNIPNGSESQSIFGNDRSVFMWMNASQMGYYHQNNLGFMGFYYVRPNIEYSPTTWVRFNLNYFWIGDTSTGNPGSYSASARNPFTQAASGFKQVNSPLGARQDQDDDYVGSELNLITTLNIYKNFDYNIGLAVFWPGAMYNIPGQADASTSYAINTKLIYAF
jgi:hypothetical protein